MLHSISSLRGTTPEQEWPNGTEFSGYSDFPEYKANLVHPKFRNEIPQNVCSIRSQTRNFRNFWSNGKRPRLPWIVPQLLHYSPRSLLLHFHQLKKGDRIFPCVCLVKQVTDQQLGTRTVR